MGCRLDSPSATSAHTDTILGLRVDHCMAPDAHSPVVQWAWTQHRARAVGYSLGDMGTALAADADIVLNMHDALTAAKG